MLPLSILPKTINLSSESAIGFISFPIPGGNSFSFTTWLGVLLRQLETLFGPRDMSYTPLGIEFNDEGPMVWYPGNCKYISIILSKNAATNIRQAIFQLAHETTHLLSPSSMQKGLHIEEGLATFFQLEVNDYLQLNTFLPQDSKYLKPANLVKELLSYDIDIIKNIRSKEGKSSFNSWKPEDLLQEAPQFPEEKAEFLCSSFYG